MTEIHTTYGRVRGRVEDGLHVFRGIPFAAPPVGTRRFAAPEPPEPWADILDATAFGPVPPQSAMSVAGPDAPRPVDDGRGWLTANVWSADVDGRRPVMVWIYGGAYRAGSSAEPGYEGTVLAREHGVVVVTFNHRVGVEGYGQIEGAPANRGLLDQVAALEWVRDNAAAVGGDPAQVTVFGESAGAGAVASLLAMPRAVGLFRRAIAQSVPGTFFSADLAADVMITIAAGLDRRATVDDLRDVDPDELATAADRLRMREHLDRWGVVALTPTPFSPVVDGDVLPTTPWRALREGAAADVELIVGHNRDEFRLFLALAGVLGTVTPGMAEGTLTAFAPDADAFRAAYPDASDEKLVELVQSDWLFRMPSLRLAQEHQGRSHVYELTLEAPGRGGVLGACHGLDVPLVFGTAGGALGTMLLGAEPGPEVEAASAAMRAAWTGFARGEGPGWPAWSEAREAWVVDARPVVGTYPEETSAALWAGHEFAPLPLT
ncbi:carboxylesterase/lipase family protein [Actinomycetospora termitidis]|uniref:Carboxylesterase family protein n=1 Tax=Actinomycetospora termitidis TaxID=3053470 RepID=A0ABT7MK67_9PSEU|nr:carboxylesterase family protein [Actinomycetospora sp. Odt1-22]MDL5160377.1 carboxylesterase family protein [Actinomycetospora sp. Odt1-22]